VTVRALPRPSSVIARSVIGLAFIDVGRWRRRKRSYTVGESSRNRRDASSDGDRLRRGFSGWLRDAGSDLAA